MKATRTGPPGRLNGTSRERGDSMRTLWHRRDLFRHLLVRDISGRYRGSILGLLWSFGHPVFMLAIYTLVLQGILGLRWDHAGDDKAGFATFLFVGLIVHALFSECLGRAPTLLLEQPNFVKKVVFPLEMLAWVQLGTAAFHAAVSLAVLFLFQILFGDGIRATSVLVPVVLAPPLLLLLGLILLLAGLGVYLRDVAQTMVLVNSALLFLSPVFYPLSAVPVGLREYLSLNPLAFVIEQMRAILILGDSPDWLGLLIYTLVAFGVFALGRRLFRWLRKDFAEVM